MVRRNDFSRDKLVHEFGIGVREELVLCDARVLPPPRVYLRLGWRHAGNLFSLSLLHLYFFFLSPIAA